MVQSLLISLRDLSGGYHINLQRTQFGISTYLVKVLMEYELNICLQNVLLQ